MAKVTNLLHGPLALTLGYPISNATKLVHFLMICSIMEDLVVVLCKGLLNKWHVNNKIILASSFGTIIPKDILQQDLIIVGFPVVRSCYHSHAT
jgi:hypothetical protein